jgi:hypothetical protein
LGGLTASGTDWKELVMLPIITNFRLYCRQNVGSRDILSDGGENGLAVLETNRESERP